MKPKPVVDLKRCFASKDVCMAIKVCPFGAINYAEADEPIMDKTLECNCNERESLGLKPMSIKPGGGCDCAGGCESESNDPLYDCGGTPYGRIIIDYDKCTRCGLCAKECCGTAIGIYPAHYKVDAKPVKSKQSEKASEMPDMVEMAKMFDMCQTMCKGMSKDDMMKMCEKIMNGGMNKEEMIKMCSSMMFCGSSDRESEQKNSNCCCTDGCC